MGETRNIIHEVRKANRKATLINTVLWVVIGLLLAGAGWITHYAVTQKEQVQVLLDKQQVLNNTLQQTNTELEEQKEALKISQENLEGEKAKLEEISVRYDSLRQAMLELESQDDLWDITVQTNTVQAYTDYIKLRGVDDRVIEKLNSVMDDEGYVQIQESNGTMLFEKIQVDGGLNIWVPKSTRSVRNGVIGKDRNSGRNGDVIVKGQPVQIVEDSIYTGRARWAKIKY